MAAKYRKIDPRFWGDEKVKQLVPAEKLVALYLITAQSNRCGIFMYSHGMAREHTRIKEDSYAKAFTSVCEKLEFSYDVDTSVLYIPTWWKYNPPENPKHLQGCLQDIHDLPSTRLLEEFWSNQKHLESWAIDHFEACRDSYADTSGKGHRYQKQKQKQEQNTKGEEGGGTQTVEAIYELYPRKADRRHALKAIRSAMSRVRSRRENNSDAWLIERTRLYASAVRSALKKGGSDSKIPFPATWFNGDRFDDDEREWQSPILIGAEHATKPASRRSPADRGEYSGDLPLGVRKLPSDSDGGGQAQIPQNPTQASGGHLRIAQ